MKIKHLIALAGATLLTAACSSDDVGQQSLTPTDQVPVTLSYSTTAPVADTRAKAATNLNDDYIASDQTVRVRISNHNADSWTDWNYTTAASGAMTLPDPAPYYPLDGTTHIDIKAFFPTDAADGVHEVLADQSTDANYIASDLMWATPLTDLAKTTSAQALTFTHKMAKIVVNASVGTQVSQINSVTLKQVYRKATFALGDGTTTVKTADETAGNVTMATGETGTSVACAAVIPQQTITGTLLEIGVTKTDGTTGTATYTVPSGKLFTAGYVYTLNITVSWPEVGTTTEVTGWDAATGVVNIHPTGSPFLTFTVGGVSFKMVYVEGTDNDITLTVGNQTTPGSGAAATYVTQVVKGLSGFHIGQTEVTNDLWVAVMGGTAPSEKNKGNKYPVTNVTYTQLMGTGDGTAADCFIKKLNDLAASQLPIGKKFTLPSQVQWQFAAQGGNYSNGYTYAGSSTWGESAWEGDNSGSTTHIVATKPANELGLYDMSGNVWEWCGDWYYVATNGAELSKDYWCNTAGSYRVIRGGSWYATSTVGAYFQPRFRHAWSPSNQVDDVGFRLALQ